MRCPNPFCLHVFVSPPCLTRSPDHSPALAAIVVSSDIPSFGTPEWEAFIEKDGGNFQVWLEAQFKE